MDIRRQIVVFDAADIDTESAFWAGVLGGTTEAEPTWTNVLDGAGEWRIAVQLAPDHVAPDWPHNMPGQQVHLDFHVADFAASHDHVMSLGARVLDEWTTPNSPEGFQVYASPAGHPFCLCWHD